MPADDGVRGSGTEVEEGVFGCGTGRPADEGRATGIPGDVGVRGAGIGMPGEEGVRGTGIGIPGDEAAGLSPGAAIPGVVRVIGSAGVPGGAENPVAVRVGGERAGFGGGATIPVAVRVGGATGLGGGAPNLSISSARGGRTNGRWQPGHGNVPPAAGYRSSSATGRSRPQEGQVTNGLFMARNSTEKPRPGRDAAPDPWWGFSRSASR